MAAAAAGDQPGLRGTSRASLLRVHPSPSSTNAVVASSSSSSSLVHPPPTVFQIFCKGRMPPVTAAAAEVVEGLGDGGDPDGGGIPVLEVAVCRPEGEVVLGGHKPVPGFVAAHDDDDDDAVLLEGMALVEGLHTAIRMGITRVNAVTDHRMLHNYMLGLSRPTGEKLVDMVTQVQVLRKQFKQCEISLVKQGQIEHMVKLPKEGLDVEIAKYLATKAKQVGCMICFDDVDTTKIHAVAGCFHRFCLSCMKKHMEVMLLNGMAPRCPQVGCTTKLTMEVGSKVLLPSRLLEMMAQRVEEERIHPSQRIYCPYPKCSALMSLSEVQAGSSCSDDMACNDAAKTLWKCVKCGEPMCVDCKAAWHEGMSCEEYQRLYPHGGPEGERLQKLARQRQWKRCERCNHMIELAMGCAYITCMCGNVLCYICGKTLTEDGRCACTELPRRRGGCFSLAACWRGVRH